MCAFAAVNCDIFLKKEQKENNKTAWEEDNLQDVTRIFFGCVGVLTLSLSNVFKWVHWTGRVLNQ